MSKAGDKYDAYRIYDENGELIAVTSYDQDTSPDAQAELLATDLEVLRDLGQLVGQYEIQPETGDDLGHEDK